ncbi:alpha/beta hydrolase [Mesorhizobium erdmanii]|uniref:alpha/beta hydrolase n=1 Tax=Mesorhizobium erdmanii TaxID=1777866 RepID=UPI0003FD15B4|nr:alpha/beta hydrolase [Mesorhizobium erdmanii]
MPAIAGVALAGCASGHHHFDVTPLSAQAPETTTVDMLAVTMRAPTGERTCAFSGERGKEQSICRLVVSIPSDSHRRAGEVQWPRDPKKPDPQRDFVTLSATNIEPQALDLWFRKAAGKKRRLLVFVHGFNTNFDEGVYRLAQIVHDSGANAAPVLFSWPSRGHALSYIYDNASATYSRDSLAFLLERAAQDPNVDDIVIMAHSLGNWIMMEALRQLAIRHGSVPAKIGNVIMAAPDLDVDVYRAQLLQLGPKLPRTTIFVSKDDAALAFSQRLAGGVDRLGAADPDLPRYASQLSRFNIEVIDLTKVKSDDPLNHGKFAASPEVVRLIGQRLIEGQQVEGRGPDISNSLRSLPIKVVGAE